MVGVPSMNWQRAIAKTLTLAIVGFLIPIAVLMPLEYAVSEFAPRQALATIVSHSFFPSLGCSLLFAASAIVSVGPARRVTFVQAVFLLGTTFVVSTLAFVPLHHTKSLEPRPGEWIPFVNVLFMFLLLIVAQRTWRREPA